ncbi:MAG: hypothetical protein WCJ35_22390 [Planctomycetota bacterium]
MRTTCTLFSVLAIFSTLAVSSAMAKDDPLEFLHLLQKEGFPDIAIDYLDQIKADPNAPKEILDLWELEMSRSKKEAAKQAYSDAQAKQLTEESNALLERFVKANPDRPEAIQEAAKRSEEQAQEGQYLVFRAGYMTDKKEKAATLAKARNLFEDIRQRFVQAEKSSAKLFAALPPKASRKRADAAIMVGENRLTVAMIDFYLAQTQEEGSQRTAALTKSTKDFDSIYQEFREASQDQRRAFLGCRAHFWHARILQELGQASEAKAIFDEVTSYDTVEDPSENKQPGKPKSLKPTGLEGFFADVEQYYLRTLHQLSEKDYFEEAKTWRATHKTNSEKCYGYQALTLEYAKHLLEAKTESDKQAAIKLLGEMGKIPSPYQQDAIKLRRQLSPNATAEQGFEDAVIDGDAAVEKRKWTAAIENFEKAIAAKTDKTDKQRLASVQNTLVGCYHNRAMQLYQSNKAPEAIATAQKALKGEYLKTKAAAGVAVFLLNVQYYQYLGAAESTEEEKKAKGEILTKVSKTATGILSIKDWAAKEEGDAARIVLLRLALAQDKVAEADKTLSEINPNSKEYPRAITVMGFAHWFKYKTAKKQIEADQANKVAIDKDRIAKRDEDRKQAVDFTEKAVKALDTPRTNDAAIPETLRESQLLLAEIYSEGNDFKQAAALYKPLVAEIIKDSTKPFSDTTLRIFNGAGHAYLQLSDVENITTLGTNLVELGPDQGQVNLAILNFAKRLENKRKDAMTESDSGDLTAQGAGESKLKSLTDLQEKIMINLSKRDKLAPASMIWIVKTSNNLGTDDAKTAAAELIEKIIDKANNDQNFEKEIEKAKAALQSLGAIIQAQRGEFEKAKDLIDQLIQTYPRVLDPQVSRAKILTEWAAKDPSKYGAAIMAWDSLREKLVRMSAKTDPKGNDAKKLDPKYEVILNEADCFFRMVQKTKSKDDAKKGLDLLIPYLNLDPNIRAPSDEYKEISFRYFQVGGKLADFLGVPRPVRPKIKRTSSF